MFFAPEARVIVVGMEDEMDMGTVIHHDEVGIVLLTTHQSEIVKVTATEDQREMIVELFDDMSPKELQQFGRDNGLSLFRRVTWKTERLRNACISYALNKCNKEAVALVPLLVPVKQWITYNDVRRVKDAVDYMQETSLRNLDFDAGSEYSETKTKTEDPETI